ncbi:MAG: TIM barrel protein [Synergistaceae bacterium]|nr:TIM barrel protein [Synergistaceae bacterium]
MKISVCVDALFKGKDFIESVRDLYVAGVPAFEFWSWWDKDLQSIKNAKAETGMEISAFCTKFISLVDKRAHDSYLDGLKQSLQAANSLGCKRLISQTGYDTGYPREYQLKTMMNGLLKCLPYLQEAGVTLLVEPLNLRIDHAGYFLSTSIEAFWLIESINSPYIKVLFDIYHQQVTEGNIINNITENIDKIGHFHAAGLPGRAELFNGELNYQEICRSIDETGYNGYLGLEYFPKKDVINGIKNVLAYMLEI